MSATPHYLYGLILACEVAFWVVLLLGLAARYALRRPRLGKVLLLSLPAIDLLLLAFTAMDLRGGRPATFAHGLATAYIGFTIAFATVMVRWADARFAHRFAGAPAPARTQPWGWAAVREELDLWLRCIVAWFIAAVLVTALIAYVDDAAATRPLLLWYRIAFFSVVLWFVFGPLWSVVFFRRKPR